MSDHGIPLHEEDLDPDPLRQFARWFDAARAGGARMPEAAALATASARGAPSVRMVLVKAFDEQGFTFYTNHRSRKGRELEANPAGALLFYWEALGRQVRLEGPVARAGRQESADYVRTRPRGSQLSALASPQSQVIASREALEQLVAGLRKQYGDGELPLPESWGGYRLRAETFEFWQQREDRLHDRLRYRRAQDGSWAIERLAP